MSYYKYDKNMSKHVVAYLHGEQKAYFEAQKKRLKKDTNAECVRAILEEHKKCRVI